MNVFRLSGAFLLVVGASYLTGCNQTQPMNPPKAEGHDHDHEHGHDHEHEHGHAEAPKSYADAVAKIEEARDEIREAIAKKDKEADHHLHEMFDLLEHAGSLAKKEGHEAAAAIEKTKEELLDHFEKIDAKFHNKAGAEYEELSKEIDAGIEALKQHVKK